MNELDVTTRDVLRVPDCRRATVCLWADSDDEKTEFTIWLTRWRTKLSYISCDYGCGCCIHLFDIEGPKEAIAALRVELLARSDWTENGVTPGLGRAW